MLVNDYNIKLCMKSLWTTHLQAVMLEQAFPKDIDFAWSQLHVSKVLLEHSQSFMYVLSVTAFGLEWQIWIVATETEIAWPAKPKYYRCETL